MRTVVCTVLVLVGISLPLCAWGQGDDALTVAAKQVSEQFVNSADAKRGEVAELDSVAAPKILYVSLGTKDGVHEGQLLEIAAKGDPIVVGGETIGFKETPIGTAEITRVQSDRLCMATVKNVTPGVAITKGSIAYLKPVPGTLAVSTFLRPDNAATMMGQEFADKLGMALQASGRFQMVERTRFEAVLKELGLILNDLFDPTKAVRLGKQLQAKGVVMGTLTQQNDRYAINARVVDVETGVQVASAAVSCNKSTELDGKYAQAVGMNPPPPPPSPVEVVVPPPPPLETKRLFLDLSAEAAASDQIRFQKNISIGDIIFREPTYVGYKFDDRKKTVVGTVSFLLNREWSRCTLTFGYDKMWGWERIPAGQLTVKGDGKVLADARIEAGKANQVTANVTGVDSLVITFEHAGRRFGEYSNGLIFGDCSVSKGGPP